MLTPLFRTWSLELTSFSRNGKMKGLFFWTSLLQLTITMLNISQFQVFSCFCVTYWHNSVGGLYLLFFNEEMSKYILSEFLKFIEQAEDITSIAKTGVSPAFSLGLAYDLLAWSLAFLNRSFLWCCISKELFLADREIPDGGLNTQSFILSHKKEGKQPRIDGGASQSSKLRLLRFSFSCLDCDPHCVGPA